LAYERCHHDEPEDRLLCVACARKALAARDEENERLKARIEKRAEQAEAECDALKQRVSALESSMVRHFQEEHLAGDGPEIDRWKARVAELERERDAARAERNGIISRLRLKWPHIEIGERGKRRDPGPPTCLRCAIEDMIGEPYHDGLGPPRGESAAAQDPEPPSA